MRREFNYETEPYFTLPASCIEHRLEFGVTKPAIVSCVVSAVREWTQLYYHVNQVRRRNVLLNFVKSRARGR